MTPDPPQYALRYPTAYLLAVVAVGGTCSVISTLLLSLSYQFYREKIRHHGVSIPIVHKKIKKHT